MSFLVMIIFSIGINIIIMNGEEDIQQLLKDESVYSGEIIEENLLNTLVQVRDNESFKGEFNPLIYTLDDLVKSYNSVDILQYSRLQDYTSNFLWSIPSDYSDGFYFIGIWG